MGSVEEKGEAEGLFCQHSNCVCPSMLPNQFIRKNAAHQWNIKMSIKNNFSENKLHTTDTDSKEKWIIRTSLLDGKLTQVLVLFSVPVFPLILCLASEIIRLYHFRVGRDWRSISSLVLILEAVVQWFKSSTSSALFTELKIIIVVFVNKVVGSRKERFFLLFFFQFNTSHTLRINNRHTLRFHGEKEGENKS